MKAAHVYNGSNATVIFSAADLCRGRSHVRALKWTCCVVLRVSRTRPVTEFGATGRRRWRDQGLLLCLFAVFFLAFLCVVFACSRRNTFSLPIIHKTSLMSIIVHDTSAVYILSDTTSWIDFLCKLVTHSKLIWIFTACAVICKERYIPQFCWHQRNLYLFI